jgi:hypothetical protein
LVIDVESSVLNDFERGNVPPICVSFEIVSNKLRLSATLNFSSILKMNTKIN